MNIKVLDLVENLNLDVLANKKYLLNEIKNMDVTRLGLELTGWFKSFDSSRVAVLGKGEVDYLSEKNEEERYKILAQVLEKKVPALILTKKLKVKEEFWEKFEVPILFSNETTSILIAEIVSFLEEQLAQTKVIHGVVMQISGFGVLIRGKSGVGKSELALELLKRGHRFVADDVVVLKKTMKGKLLASAFDNLKNIMEVRGLGLIDVSVFFGINSVLDSIFLDFQVYLDEEAGEENRLGLDENWEEILGAKLFTFKLPVRAGRNMATLIETAAMYFDMKRKYPNKVHEIFNKIRGL